MARPQPHYRTYAASGLITGHFVCDSAVRTNLLGPEEEYPNYIIVQEIIGAGDSNAPEANPRECDSNLLQTKSFAASLALAPASLFVLHTGSIMNDSVPD